MQTSTICNTTSITPVLSTDSQLVVGFSTIVNKSASSDKDLNSTTEPLTTDSCGSQIFSEERPLIFKDLDLKMALNNED